MLSPHYLVISLGNPLPAYSTLHSAGHFVNRGLAKVFRQPEWRERRLGKSKTSHISQGPKYTLVQSPTLMNLSGEFAFGAWRDMCQKHDVNTLSVVILHDELERNLGKVDLLPWNRGARGHNGVKDVQNSFRRRPCPTSTFCRISIGIGRPVERDPDTVVQYVMKQLSAETRGFLEEVVPFEVARRLAEHEEKWRQGKYDRKLEGPD